MGEKGLKSVEGFSGSVDLFKREVVGGVSGVQILSDVFAPYGRVLVL